MSDYPDDLLKEARKICSAWLHVDGPYRDALGLVVQGMMAERERCAGVLASAAFSIEEEERGNRQWGGPDPRGYEAAPRQLEKARRLRGLAAAIRKGTA